MSYLIKRLPVFGVFLLAAAAFVLMPARITGSHWMGYVAGAILFAGVVWMGASPALRQYFPAFPPVTPQQARRILVALLLLGLSARALWVIFVPPVQMSDFATYIGLAQNLLRTGEYVARFQADGRLQSWYAFWPPGYPTFLAGCMTFIHSSQLPVVTNLILYFVSSLALYSFTAFWAGRTAGLLAVALFAIWPSHIALSGLAATEHLFIPLLLLSLLALIQSEKHGLGLMLLAGILLGFATLVRPVVLAFPAVWLLFQLHRLPRLGKMRAASGFLVACLGLAAVVLPWTVRNYRRLGAWVPVGTNGGVNFYQANNPLATADYSEAGLEGLHGVTHYDELLTAKTGYAWGKAWVRQNPGRFVQLVLERQVALLGEDIEGPYFSVRMRRANRSLLYWISAAVCQFWWLIVWALATVGMIRRRELLYESVVGRLCLWTVLFWFASLVPFLTQSRYHMPCVPIVIALGVLALVSPVKECDTYDLASANQPAA
jgi:4-amino-4-deoxy-L-arabinose transferase-like glycosyltransferase